MLIIFVEIRGFKSVMSTWTRCAESVVTDYHVYMDRWIPATGDRLQVEIEVKNSHDRYAVAVLTTDYSSVSSSRTSQVMVVSPDIVLELIQQRLQSMHGDGHGSTAGWLVPGWSLEPELMQYSPLSMASTFEVYRLGALSAPLAVWTSVRSLKVESYSYCYTENGDY